MQPSLRPPGKYSQRATLKFFYNRIPGKSSPWTSCHERRIVFPDDDLRDAITEKNLIGRNLRVLLKKKLSGFIASRDPDRSLTGQDSDLIGKKVAVAIDIQNLSCSLESLEKTAGKRLSLYDTIFKVLADFEVDLIQLFVNCKSRESLSDDWRIINQDRRFHITEVAIKTIIDPRTKKKIIKQDLDPHLLPLIGRLSAEKKYDGLVLFTGDSCFQAASEMWLGIGEYSHYAGRPAVIATSQERLSIELREIANHPRVNLMFLEDFYGLSAVA